MAGPDGQGTQRSPRAARSANRQPGTPAPRRLPGTGTRHARWLTAATIAAASAWCAAVALRAGPSPLLPALCYLAAIAVPLTISDVRHQTLPDKLTLPSYPAAAGLLGIAAIWAPGGDRRLLSAAAGLAAAFALYLLLACFRYGPGGGDVKLSGVLGLYLGWFGAPTLLAGLFAGFLLNALSGTALIAAHRATIRTRTPFGPFMLAGAMAAILAFGLVGSIF